MYPSRSYRSRLPFSNNLCGDVVRELKTQRTEQLHFEAEFAGLDTSSETGLGLPKTAIR